MHLKCGIFSAFGQKLLYIFWLLNISISLGGGYIKHLLPQEGEAKKIPAFGRNFLPPYSQKLSPAFGTWGHYLGLYYT